MKMPWRRRDPRRVEAIDARLTAAQTTVTANAEVIHERAARVKVAAEILTTLNDATLASAARRR